jgi:hypothetical protein
MQSFKEKVSHTSAAGVFLTGIVPGGFSAYCLSKSAHACCTNFFYGTDGVFHRHEVDPLDDP